MAKTTHLPKSRHRKGDTEAESAVHHNLSSLACKMSPRSSVIDMTLFIHTRLGILKRFDNVDYIRRIYFPLNKIIIK